ncbi:hypothetical protein BHE90_005714 [Fusarium euwallaceae]|uniref:CCHC-type domain-containing protein n=1 Tax=Fusarium euwallaceae TaxID=1147111 RepID=A0A430LVL6_9HYPO|nr:hypothetical protein BHE90_005714 [Fusarium euwallaceae]
MTESKDNGSEHHGSGGDDLSWTKPIYGFLKVNGVPISTPTGAAMKSLARPGKESLDIAWQFSQTSTTSPTTHLTLSARGFEEMGDEYIGRVSIRSIDMTGLETREEKDAKSALQCFFIHLTIKCLRGQISFRHGALHKLHCMGRDGQQLHKRLKFLRETVGAKTDADIQIDLYFPPEVAGAVADVSSRIRPSAPHPSQKGVLVCFVCKEVGHRASECAKKKAARKGHCHDCGMDGHKRKNCPNKDKP